MRIIAQRAKNSFVTIEGDTVGSIESGLVLLLGVGREDTEEDIDFLVGKVVNLRIFEDGEGKMNESLLERAGGRASFRLRRLRRPRPSMSCSGTSLRLWMSGLQPGCSRRIWRSISSMTVL